MKKCKECGKNVVKGRNYCQFHRYMREQIKNPVKFWFNVLKRNAKRRGKEFTITLDDFKQFCYQYDYVAKKGISAKGLTVDRINEDLGYVPGNIQALTNSENVKKYHSKEYVITPENKLHWYTGKTESTIEDLPF